MYYIEIDDAGLASPDAAVVVELLKQKAWEKQKEPTQYFRLRSLQSIRNSEHSVFEPDAIPVGSLDFAEQILGTDIQPLNIPDCLRDPSYISRRMVEATAKEIPSIFARWHTETLFIKSMTLAKTPYNGLYSKKGLSLLSPVDRYLVSEPLSFLAEWRCFVYQGKILDIRRYAGSYKIPFLPCDVEFAKDIVKTVDAGLRPKLEAYTLDLGKTTARDVPVIVELHNFISCGLYGFEDPAILHMLAAAANRERIKN